jgi:hypothetical protein
MGLHKLLDIGLLLILSWNAKLLGNISIRLVKTVHIRRRYPKD